MNYRFFKLKKTKHFSTSDNEDDEEKSLAGEKDNSINTEKQNEMFFNEKCTEYRNMKKKKTKVPLTWGSFWKYYFQFFNTPIVLFVYNAVKIIN